MKSNMYFLNLQNMYKETRIDFESSRTDSDSSMQTEEIKKTVQMKIKVVI